MRDSDNRSTDPNEFPSDWQETAERGRIIAETASDGIITIDKNSKILFANQAVEGIFGYSIPELVGQELTLLMPEYLKQVHRTGIQRYIETGKRHISWKGCELTGLNKNGKEIYLEVSFGEFSKGDEHFFTGILRDVTRRKQDKILLDLRNCITLILAEANSLPEASVKVIETFCNELRWQVGEFWTIAARKDHLQLVASWHDPTIESSRFHTASDLLPGVGVPGRIWLSKEPLWLDQIPRDENTAAATNKGTSEMNTALGFPILVGGEIIGVINFIGRDIQKPDPALIEMVGAIGSQIGQFIERKNAQEEVQRMLHREHRARLQAEALTRQLAALQRVADIALTNLPLNELLQELLKRSREVLNVDTAAVLLLEKEGQELLAWAAVGLEEEVERGVRVPFGKGFAGKIVAEGKPRIISNVETADVYNPLLKEKGICSLLGAPLIVEGRTIGVIHVGTFAPSKFTDEDTHLLQLVAERIALAIEKARLVEIEAEARAVAEKANTLKDEFLTILSHELRTPLTPIMGWSHMMQGGLLAEEDYGQAVAVITKNSQSLKRLIDDLLDMSAILSGKMRMDRARISLSTVLRDAVESLKIEARQADVKLVLPEFTEDVTINGDRARLLQSFSNILHNAIKFTPQGGTVEISIDTSGSDVIVTVQDSGIGIDQEFLPHVFERFRQADGSRTRMHGGLGLGLALVKSFVEAHGGSISVKSNGRDRGTTFSVRLPLESTTSIIGRSLPRDKEPKSSGRILIIEDQIDTLDMLAVTFAARGFEVVPCESGAQAIQAVEQKDFDVIISDIAMPEIDGFELIRRLRQMPRLKQIPAVALTGYASEKDAVAAMRAGFDLHLCKPVDPAELTKLVEQLLEQSQLKTI